MPDSAALIRPTRNQPVGRIKAQPHPAISLLRLLKIVAKRRKHPLPFRRFSLN
ncbi:hypothetical protein OFY05_01435 [Pseudocitrobacter faecalis]|nr:hypothetical protein OFY05_01435 [Pseudocitrobacter faecalis]